MVTREGIKIAAVEVLATALVFLVYKPLSIPLILAVAFTLFFFRDPERSIERDVVSPADGKVDFVSEKRVEIFMSPFDCHVQRAPVSGIVRSVKFVPGKKLPAFIRGESEKSVIEIESEDGTFKVEQIAGAFARRIRCWVKEGERVEKGQKIGMIAFGSRVALEVPEKYKIVRAVGEKVKAGETIAVRDEQG